MHVIVLRYFWLLYISIDLENNDKITWKLTTAKDLSVTQEDHCQGLGFV